MADQYRQGDVLLVQLTDEQAATERRRTPAKVARDHDKVVLAYGEESGHAHAISALDASLLSRDLDTPGAFRMLDVPSGAELVHEILARGEPTTDHAAISLPPGAYRVVVQRAHVAGSGTPAPAED